MSADSSGVKMLNRIARVVRWPHLWAYIAAAVMVFGACNFLFATKYYKCSTKFLPASALSGDGSMPMLGSLGKMASQFGFDVGGGGADPSLLFPEIVHSYRMGNLLLNNDLHMVTGDSLSLFHILNRKGPYSDLNRERAIGQLNGEVISMSLNKGSNITTLSVVLDDPVAALELSRIVVGELDSFYSNAKKAVARDKQEYVTSRLALASRELEENEDALKVFRESNRQQYGSPELELKESRLVRKVGVQQEIYSTLKSQEIVIGIQSSSSVSQIIIVDGPVLPRTRYSPTVGRIGLKWLSIYLAIVALVWGIRMRLGDRVLGRNQ